LSAGTFDHWISAIVVRSCRNSR